MTVGVLALQGDFDAHQRALAEVGVQSVQVREPEQLASVDGLILPGGESTTMLKLLDETAMKGPLADFAKDRPVLATCAGVILLAREVTRPRQESLGLLDVVVERNGYGRQLASSIRRVEVGDAFANRTEPGPLEAVFIRAPIIRSVGAGVTVLASDGEDPILVEQGPILAATFHPELTGDRRIQRLFLDKIRHGAACRNKTR